MSLELRSPCKVNLILNILGKRADGFHELETLMHPIPFFDSLTFAKNSAPGIQLSCSDPLLRTDESNLVYKAAKLFGRAASVDISTIIHLEKRIPMAAGLGGGSGNAATTLLGLNQLYDSVLSDAALQGLAAELGSDVPFFLQSCPAIGLGRGEQIHQLSPYPILEGCWIILVHPGFGISTPWAYQQLARFPEARNGIPGRAAKLDASLRSGNWTAITENIYNSLEAPALEKYPLLELFQTFFKKAGAVATLMSGSGSTTFAITDSDKSAKRISAEFRSHFGESFWMKAMGLGF